MDLNGVPSVQVVRQSNSSYRMLNEKYMIRRKKKDAMLQYATLYFQRLEKLRPMVREAAQMKWAKMEDDDKKVQFVNNILDIRPFVETVIIGTFFKEQKLKPSILNNIMGTLGQKKFEDLDGKFLHGEYVDSANDSAVLEDISGRITIKNSDNFNINVYVSGTVMAMKGQAKAGGYFEVNDVCYAGIPFNQSVPNDLKLLGQKRDIFDPQALQPDSGREFVAFISGLKFGYSQSLHFQTEFLLRFFKGELGSTCVKDNQEVPPDSRLLASQIKRVIIAGDSMVQPQQIDEVLRGSYRTNKLNQEVYSNISDVIDTFETFLDGLSETIDVDVMPGEQDFSNSFMPQQPFNSCIFPRIAENQRQSVNLVTNPH